MNDLILGIIIGIGIMSIFGFISAVLCFDLRKEGLAFFFTGPITWIVFLCSKIAKHIYCFYILTRFRSLIVVNGKIKHISPKYIVKYDVKFAHWDDYHKQENWDYKLWNKRFRFPNAHFGSVRYAPKKVWKRYPKADLKELKKI